jgi:hypothetical protein
MATAAPLPALALHGDTSALTAIGNDYGLHRDLRAAGARARPSRRRPAAAVDQRAQPQPAGRGPGGPPVRGADLGAHRSRAQPAGRLCADAVCVPGDTATVQETHLAAIHMLCRAIESALPVGDSAGAPLAAS